MSVDQTSHDQVSLTKCPITRYSPFLLYNSVGARVSEKIFVVDREKRVCVESDLPKLDSGTFESPPLLCHCPCNRSPSPYKRLCSFVSLSFSVQVFLSFSLHMSLFFLLSKVKSFFLHNSVFFLSSNLSFPHSQFRSFFPSLYTCLCSFFSLFLIFLSFSVQVFLCQVKSFILPLFYSSVSTS